MNEITNLCELSSQNGDVFSQHVEMAAQQMPRQSSPSSWPYVCYSKFNTEHVQGLGANGKAAFSPKAHG